MGQHYYYNRHEYSSLSDLVGKTMKSVEVDGNERVTFTTEDGTSYYMYHSQNCCEHVYLKDINGDVQDLVGSPITLAEESTNRGSENDDVWGNTFTWTFYKFATLKGYVDITWYGSSNGYYSESVDLYKSIPDEDVEEHY